MNKEYLLTFAYYGVTSQYAWFDTEEEMIDFIESTPGIEVNDAIKIVVVEEINYKEE